MLFTSKDFSTTRLESNHIYRVRVEIDGEIKEWKFYTKLNPYYSTKRKVRSDYRSVLTKIPDAHIDLMIYENSKYAYEIANETVLSELDRGNVPNVVERYVRAKTQLDIIRDLLLANSVQAGVSEKSLGDFKITYEFKTPDLEAIRDMIEPKVDQLETALAGSNIARSAVRAGSNPYPFEGRSNFTGAGE